MKHYIIDGNNLIGKIKKLSKIHVKDKIRSREQLAFIIERSIKLKKAEVSLHFDGFADLPINIPHIKIIYSENSSADTKIKQQIEKSKNPRNLIVVTSDNNLQQFGKVCGCTVMKSEEFSAQFLVEDEKLEEESRIKNIDDDEEFKKLFGVK